MTLINFPVSKYLINELPGNGWPASGTHTYNGYGYTHYAADSLSGASIPAGFPSNPTNGAKHIYQYRTYEFLTDTWTSPEIWAINISTVYSVVGGATYMWDGEKWTASNIPDSSNAIHVAPSTLNANEYLKWTGTEWTGEDGVGAEGPPGPTGPTGPAGPIGGIQLTYKSSTTGLSHGEFGFDGNVCKVKIVPANDPGYVLANVLDTITTTNDSDSKTYVMLHEGNAWVDAFWIRTNETVDNVNNIHSFEVNSAPSLTNDTSYYWLLNMQGHTGEKGDDGDDGQQGDDGDDGTKITYQPSSPGWSGNVGDFYINSADADKGFWEKTAANEWSYRFDMKGEEGQDGQDGDDGAQIYYQDNTPGTAVGNVGDLWIDSNSTNKTLYRKDAVDAAWVQKFDLKGDDGQDGLDSTVEGPQGPAGTMGGIPLVYGGSPYGNLENGEFTYDYVGGTEQTNKFFIKLDTSDTSHMAIKDIFVEAVTRNTSSERVLLVLHDENNNIVGETWVDGDHAYDASTGLFQAPTDSAVNANLLTLLDTYYFQLLIPGAHTASDVDNRLAGYTGAGASKVLGRNSANDGFEWLESASTTAAQVLENKTLKNYSEKGASSSASGSGPFGYTCDSSLYHLYQLDFDISGAQTVNVDIAEDYQSMTIAIDTHGQACTFQLPGDSTLTGIEWVGGSAPSINTTEKYAVLEFFRLQGVVFGCKVGDFS